MTNTNMRGIFAGSHPPVVFLDFDGTVSKRDVIDAILEEFADKKWLEIEQLWIDGQIGSRECLSRQFDLVRVSPGELDEFLDDFELDDGVFEILGFCREMGSQAHIVSDGFEYYIRRMLGKHIGDAQVLSTLDVWANRLFPVGNDRWQTSFPHKTKICLDGCATCKPAVMRIVNTLRVPTIFIGDGLSDRFAAENADIVYAKDKLGEFCRQNKVEHLNYSDLYQVAGSLKAATESVAVAFEPGLGEFSLSPA